MVEEGTPQGGGGNEDWRQALGPEFAEHPSLAPIKSEDFVQVPRGVVKRYVDQQQFIGGERLPKPKEDWGDEQWNDLLGQLGRPESVEGYQLPELDLPEGFDLDEEYQKGILADAHEAGITDRQMGRFWERFVKREAEQFEREQQEEQNRFEAAKREVQKKFGASYNARLDLANRALSAAAGEEGKEAVDRWKEYTVDGVSLLAHPVFVELLGALGEKLHEGDLLPGGGAPRFGGKSAQQLEQELETFRAENGAILVDDSHPQHRILTQKLNDLSDALALARAKQAG